MASDAWVSRRLKAHDELYTAFMRYRREEGNDTSLDRKIKKEGEKILEENDPRKQSRINVHSVFWMVAAMCVFYYTDFYIAIKVDDRIHRQLIEFVKLRFWLNLGGLLIGVNIVIGAYFVIWVSYYLKISNWDNHNTVLIPIATASFIAGMICCTYALWPVWGVLTPFIIFTEFMGVVFLATLIPI